MTNKLTCNRIIESEGFQIGSLVKERLAYLWAK